MNRVNRIPPPNIAARFTCPSEFVEEDPDGCPKCEAPIEHEVIAQVDVWHCTDEHCDWIESWDGSP